MIAHWPTRQLLTPAWACVVHDSGTAKVLIQCVAGCQVSAADARAGVEATRQLIANQCSGASQEASKARLRVLEEDCEAREAEAAAFEVHPLCSRCDDTACDASC